jgi:hypothetical protein
MGRQMKPLKKWDRLIVNDFTIGSLVSLLEFDVYTLSLFNPKTLRHPKPTAVVCPEPVAHRLFLNHRCLDQFTRLNRFGK